MDEAELARREVTVARPQIRRGPARTRRAVVAIGLAVTAAVGAVGSAPTASAADPELVVRSVTLDRSSVRVSGLATVPVRITARASKTGSIAGTRDSIYVVFTRTAGIAPGMEAPVLRLVELTLASGTPADGTYVGSTPIPSTMNGMFSVTRAYPWLDLSGGGTDPEPVTVDGPALAVTGTHIPKLTLTNAPMPVPMRAATYRFGGRLIDRDTGTGYVKPVKVTIGRDSVCVESFPSETATTDRAGYFWSQGARRDLDWLHCAVISPTQDWTNPIVGKGYWVQVRPWVSATPARTRAGVGAPIHVTGSVGGEPANCRVRLQRRDASGWRTESSGSIRQSGRFTLLARPPRAGAVTYTVSFPRCGRMWPASSRSFVIRAAR